MTEQEKDGHARSLALRKVAKEIADGIVRGAGISDELKAEIKARAAKYARALKEKGISP